MADDPKTPPSPLPQRPTVGPKGGTGTPPRPTISSGGKVVLTRDADGKVSPPSTLDAEGTTDPPDTLLPTRARVTVVSQFVHQLPGEPAHTPPKTRYYRWLVSDEDSYARTLRVGNEWTPLDLGWLKDSTTGYSLLVLSNAATERTTRSPTREEKIQLTARILEVGIVGTDGTVLDLAEIPVGEGGLSLSPRRIDRYRIRCVSSEGRYSIFLVPG